MSYATDSMSYATDSQNTNWTRTYPRRLAVYIGATVVASLIGVVLASLTIVEMVGLTVVTVVAMLPAMLLAAGAVGGSRLVGLLAGGFFAATVYGWWAFAASDNSTAALAPVVMGMVAVPVALVVFLVSRTVQWRRGPGAVQAT